MVHIPFECPVQLTSFFVITGEGARGFKKAHLYANPPGEGAMDWDEVHALEPTEKKELAPDDLCGVVEYPVRAHKYINLVHLTIHFPIDEDEPSEKQVFWIGLKGMSSNYKRKAVDTVYELLCNPSDCKKLEDDHMGANKMS